MAAHPEDDLDDTDFRNHRTRNLILGMLPRLDEIVRRRGNNRVTARLCFIRQMARVFDNLIDEGSAIWEDELRERDTRIEKMEQTISKLLTDRRDLQKALRAAKEQDDKPQNGDEKCPEVAFGPKGA